MRKKCLTIIIKHYCHLQKIFFRTSVRAELVKWNMWGTQTSIKNIFHFAVWFGNFDRLTKSELRKIFFRKIKEIFSRYIFFWALVGKLLQVAVLSTTLIKMVNGWQECKFPKLVVALESWTWRNPRTLRINEI